jgi:hypothetical protein
MSRDLSREFDVLSRREDVISSDWDAQFSEFGIHHTHTTTHDAYDVKVIDKDVGAWH